MAILYNAKVIYNGYVWILYNIIILQFCAMVYNDRKVIWTKI